MILSEMIENGLVSVVKLNGKQPIEKEWQRWSDELRPKNGLKGNYGIVCGPASGLIVLDIDDAEKFKAAGLETPQTALVKTAKGYHLYFKYPQDGKQYRNCADQSRGFDIRGHGGQVVGPGSIHPETKTEYTIVRDIEPIEAPRWLIDISGPKQAKEAENRTQSKKTGDISPLDDYNATTHPMELLTGWQYNGKSGTWEGKKTEYIVRPGKDIKNGHSGSIVHTNDSNCPFLFYNFSSNSGFEPEKSYTPADLYGEINCGGDMNMTAKSLFEMGFGSSSSQNSSERQNSSNESKLVKSSNPVIDVKLVQEINNFYDTLCQMDTPIISRVYKRYKFYDAPTPDQVEKCIFSDKDLTLLQKAFASKLVKLVSNSSNESQNSSNADYNFISDAVKEFIFESSGIFTYNDIWSRFDIRTKKPKDAVYSLIRRMKKLDQIESIGSKNGSFRLIVRDANEIDFKNVSTNPSNLILPFGMDDFVEIMPGNIIVFAGEQNAGKTALLLNIVKDNMYTHTCHYFSSEMGASEMNKRLEKFEIKIDDWNFKAYERASDFADVIVPGEGNINIIDYMEMHTDFWRISEYFAKIHNKLKGALAIIAIQKDKTADVGRGNSFSLEKPRLYCTVSPGKLKMYKAKNWATSMNPNGLCIDYTLAQGSIIIPARDQYSGNVCGWYREAEKNKKNYLKDE